MPGRNAVWVNGRDLADFGVATARLEGLHAPPPRRSRTTSMPGRYGTTLLSAEPEGAPRMLTLAGHVSAATPADLDRVVTKVLAWCSRGLLEVKSGHDVTKIYYARVADMRADPVTKQFLREHAEFSLSLECVDPLAYQALGSVVRITLNNTPRPVRIRSAHVSGWLRAWGPWTDFTVKVVDAAARVRLTLPLVGVATATEYVLIDFLLGRIYRSTGGAALVSEPNLVGPSYDFPLFLDPLWGDADRNIFPALVVTGLAAGGGCEFLYRITDT